MNLPAEVFAPTGFPSLAVQLLESLLVLVGFVLVNRHAGERTFFRLWLWARVGLVAALSVVALRYFLLPARAIAGYETVAAAAFVFGKTAYWSLILIGVLRFHRVFSVSRVVAIALPALLGYSVTAGIALPSLVGAMIAQSVIAVPALAIAAVTCARLDRDRRTAGTRLLMFVLSVLFVIWSIYLVIHVATVLGVRLGEYFAAFSIPDAYIDAILDALLACAMIVVFIEETHREIDATREARIREIADSEARLERIRRHQSAVIDLAGKPEIRDGDFAAAARVITRVAAGAAELDRVSVWLARNSRQLECIEMRQRVDGEYRGELSLADHPEYFGALGREIAVVSDSAEGARSVASLQLPGRSIDAGIRLSGEVAGVVRFERSEDAQPWRNDEVAFATDIAAQASQALMSEHRRLAENQRHTLEAQLQLAQKMESIGELAGGVAHDFNNLLCVILGYASAGTERRNPDPDVAASFEAILSAAERGAQLTQKLLAFGRCQILEQHDIDLNESIRQLLPMLTSLIPASIELGFVPCEQPVTVHADRNQLEQVVINLCINARDAMPDGGRLDIETALGPLDPSECFAQAGLEPGEYAVLRVRDTGPGIEPADHARIFDPFFTTKPEGRGTGLGLAMAYGIVKQHGGTIRARSDAGAGATFEIHLPAVDRVAVAAPPTREGPATGGHETVLVVEDDRGVREVMRGVLRQAGYFVLTACDGQDAIDVYAEHGEEIELVITDVVMPRLTGRQVYERMRQLDPGLPIVFVSGYSGSTLPEEFLDDEAAPLLSKPFDPSQLLEIVRRVLDARPIPALDAAAEQRRPRRDESADRAG